MNFNSYDFAIMINWTPTSFHHIQSDFSLNTHPLIPYKVISDYLYDVYYIKTSI